MYLCFTPLLFLKLSDVESLKTTVPVMKGFDEAQQLGWVPYLSNDLEEAIPADCVESLLQVYLWPQIVVLFVLWISLAGV